ncbi:site-2 protease family protein [Patescibacteria group bacterium]|nr:site-2 protease family protein [Patescibacteria group bacterium]MBU2472481.1 site-2 protease family protein [Patescibacteria group bacterium]
MDSFIILIFQLAILLMSVVVHEFAHGWMAFYLGDPTAKHYGRLTLNPIKHLDFFGSLVVPFMVFVVSGGQAIFGWAKPVPFNPRNLRDQRYGEAKVAAAGPLANILVALVFGLFIRFMPEQFLVSTNLIQIFGLIVFLNILLAVFNLIPIPPLDGSKILFAFLPRSLDNIRVFLEKYGTFLLLFFIFFAFQWILPLVFLIFKLIVG